MNELISVVVPIYNVEKYLKSCIDSIINQTYKNLEIILVDDGGTDKCPHICDEYENKDQRIKVIHKENGGLSDARNAGIKQAKGQYISFVDSDDDISPYMYNKLYKNIKQYNADISVCNYVFIYDGNKYNQGKTNQTISMTSEEALDMLYDTNKYGNFAWNKLYKTTLFNDIKFPYGKKYEDIFVMHELYNKANKLVFLDEGLYNYYSRESSILGTESIDAIIDYFDGMITRAKSEATKGREKYLASILLNRILKSQKTIYNKKLDSLKRELLKEKCSYCLQNYCIKGNLSNKYYIKANLCKKFPWLFVAIYKTRSTIKNNDNPINKFLSKYYIKLHSI